MMLLMNPEFKVVDLNEFDIRKLVLGGCQHHTVNGSGDYQRGAADSCISPGVTYGDYQRVLLEADVLYRKRLNVIMLAAKASPYTFLTRETLKALGVKIDDPPSDHVFVVINGMRVKVGLSKAHFKDVDVLGTHFLQYCDLHVNYPFETVTVAVLPLVPDAAAAANYYQTFPQAIPGIALRTTLLVGHPGEMFYAKFAILLKDIMGNGNVKSPT